MEQITRKDGIIYYGGRVCRNADDAYCHFRDDYHAGLGKRVYRRLNYPDRTERIHETAIVFEEEYGRELDREFVGYDKRIPTRLLGLAGVSYCWIFSGKDFPDFEEDKYWRWFEWLYSGRGRSLIRHLGKDKGRTSKRLKTRYR